MSYSKYGNQIANYLKAAGIPAVWATAIGNVLGNSGLHQVQRGEVTRDTTRKEHRFVTPDVRKHILPDVDFRDGDPDYRPPARPVTEELLVPVPQPTVIVDRSPQQDAAPFRVDGGDFIRTAGAGDNVKVNLNCHINAVPQQGLPMALLNKPFNTVIGKALRAECGAMDQGQLRFFVEQNGEEVLLKLQLLNTLQTEVVTDVRYVSGKGIVATYQKVVLWKDGGTREGTLRTQRIAAVDGFYDNGEDHSTHATVRKFEAFTSVQVDDKKVPSFVRYGKAVGAWAIDTLGSVTIWENGAATPIVIADVINHTHDVPDTGWVVIGQNWKFEWVLLSAQPHTVDVITGALINASGDLEFTKSTVRVVGVTPTTSDIIPTATCPT